MRFMLMYPGSRLNYYVHIDPEHVKQTGAELRIEVSGTDGASMPRLLADYRWHTDDIDAYSYKFLMQSHDDYESTRKNLTVPNSYLTTFVGPQRRWSIQIYQEHFQAANVTLLFTLNAQCAHGTPTLAGECNCDKGWSGPRCDQTNKGASAGLVVFLCFFMLVLGFGIAIMVKRYFPNFCGGAASGGVPFASLQG